MSVRGCDCLVDMVCEWLTRPIAGQTDEQRGEAVGEVCFYISQMRHREPAIMELEQRRWLERIALRLCAYTAGARGHEAIVLQNLEAQVTIAQLSYQEWRAKTAPVTVKQEGRP